jgi:hypothetical protein
VGLEAVKHCVDIELTRHMEGDQLEEGENLLGGMAIFAVVDHRRRLQRHRAVRRPCVG